MSDINLYLHCGYHKTASSYLQTLLSANQGFLRDHGIYYPDDATGKEAARGGATAGNGLEFALALRELDTAKANGMLRRFCEQAEEASCNRLLLSSEAFFHTFGVTPKSLDLLNTASRVAGLKTIKLLIYVRESAEHALSVYRHRGKGCFLGAPAAWVQDGYETLDLMNVFLGELEQLDGVHCTFRRYSGRRGMSETLFEHWLHVPCPPIEPIQRVRESLKISEILMIQAMEKHIPGSGLAIAQALSSQSPGNRALDNDLLEQITLEVQSRMARWDSIVELVNEKLPDEEKINISKKADFPEADADESFAADLRAVFSLHQLEVVARSLQNQISIGRRFTAQVKKLVPRPLKRMIRRQR